MLRKVIASAFVFAAAAAPAYGVEHWQRRQKGLVLLLEWANQPAAVDRATVEATFFSEGEGETSAREPLQA